MRVPVAIAHYEGAKYIGEQLCSIVEQDRPPDEILMSGKGSTDGTLDVAQKYEAHEVTVRGSLRRRALDALLSHTPAT